MKRDGHVEHLDRTSTKNNIPPICSCILGHECFKYRYSSVSLNELQILISGLFQKDRRFTGKGIVQRSIWTCLSLLSVLSSQPATFESTEVCSQLHALAAEEELKPKPEISTLQSQQQGLWYEVNTPPPPNFCIHRASRKEKKKTDSKIPEVWFWHCSHLLLCQMEVTLTPGKKAMEHATINWNPLGSQRGHFLYGLNPRGGVPALCQSSVG